MFMRTSLTARELDGVVFENYLAGLRDARWTGDSRLPRLGYAATSVMRAEAIFYIMFLRDPAFSARVEAQFGKPAAEVRSRRIELAYHKLDLADEARRLMREVDMLR